MINFRRIFLPMLALALSGLVSPASSQELTSFDRKQKSIVSIAALTARSDFPALTSAINEALDSGMTVNEAKEVIVHTYAYCGFPKALRGLQTMVAVLDERRNQGLTVEYGREATPVSDSRSKYERGREMLAGISGVPADAPKPPYALLSPEVEVFLKEHLFCDLFERDILTPSERELATVAVIAALGRGVEPMLRSHSAIARRLGATEAQISEIVDFASPSSGCSCDNP